MMKKVLILGLLAVLPALSQTRPSFGQLGPGTFTNGALTVSTGATWTVNGTATTQFSGATGNIGKIQMTADFTGAPTAGAAGMYGSYLWPSPRGTNEYHMFHVDSGDSFMDGSADFGSFNVGNGNSFYAETWGPVSGGTISSISKAANAVITTSTPIEPGAGPFFVVLSGITGTSWFGLNGSWVATWLGANSFSIPANTYGFAGSPGGTMAWNIQGALCGYCADMNGNISVGQRNPYFAGSMINFSDWTSGALGTGTVNTSGTAVTRTSGTAFDASWVGDYITIAGVAYQIAAYGSGSSITLGSSAGTQTGAAFTVMVPYQPNTGMPIFIYTPNGSPYPRIKLRGGDGPTYIAMGGGITAEQEAGLEFLNAAGNVEFQLKKTSGTLGAGTTSVAVADTLNGRLLYQTSASGTNSFSAVRNAGTVTDAMSPTTIGGCGLNLDGTDEGTKLTTCLDAVYASSPPGVELRLPAGKVLGLCNYNMIDRNHLTISGGGMGWTPGSGSFATNNATSIIKMPTSCTGTGDSGKRYLMHFKTSVPGSTKIIDVHVRGVQFDLNDRANDYGVWFTDSYKFFWDDFSVIRFTGFATYFDYGTGGNCAGFMYFSNFLMQSSSSSATGNEGIHIGNATQDVCSVKFAHGTIENRNIPPYHGIHVVNGDSAEFTNVSIYTVGAAIDVSTTVVSGNTATITTTQPHGIATADGVWMSAACTVSWTEGGTVCSRTEIAGLEGNFIAASTGTYTFTIPVAGVAGGTYYVLRMNSTSIQTTVDDTVFIDSHSDTGINRLNASSYGGVVFGLDVESNWYNYVKAFNSNMTLISGGGDIANAYIVGPLQFHYLTSNAATEVTAMSAPSASQVMLGASGVGVTVSGFGNSLPVCTTSSGNFTTTGCSGGGSSAFSSLTAGTTSSAGTYGFSGSAVFVAGGYAGSSYSGYNTKFTSGAGNDMLVHFINTSTGGMDIALDSSVGISWGPGLYTLDANNGHDRVLGWIGNASTGSGWSANVAGVFSALGGFAVNQVLGFNGTKTAGACTLTISGGIITNVTGC